MILNIHHETCRMSQIYQQAYDMLAPGLKPTFDLWVAEARRIPGGEDIVLNISSEMHLSPSVLNDFLTSISTCFLMEGHNPGSAERAYVKACNNLLNTGNQMLCCLGPQAQTDSSIRVHRIILLEKLQLMISEAMKKTSSIRNEQQEDWDNFQELVDEGDLEGCLEILSKAIPCKPDRTNWVYFNEDQSDVDPLATCWGYHKNGILVAKTKVTLSHLGVFTTDLSKSHDTSLLLQILFHLNGIHTFNLAKIQDGGGLDQ
jgi:hypothetical protein